MEFYYLSKYPIKVCLDYMSHSNLYDQFIYTWEDKEGWYLITFKEDKRRGVLSHKPVFKVMFEGLGDRTGVRAQFISGDFICFIIKTPPSIMPYIDKFWERKLDARKIKQWGITRERNLKFYYLSKYSLKKCEGCMRHFDRNDRFFYTWERIEDYYVIIFKEYRNSMSSLAGAPEPVFKVAFEELGDWTGIEARLIIPGFIIERPSAFTRDMGEFWENKLDAKKIK